MDEFFLSDDEPIAEEPILEAKTRNYIYSPPQIDITRTIDFLNDCHGWCLEVLEGQSIPNAADIGFWVKVENKPIKNLGFVIDILALEDQAALSLVVESKAKVTILKWIVPLNKYDATYMRASANRRDLSMVKLGMHVPDITKACNPGLTIHHIVTGFYEVRSTLLSKQIFPLAMSIKAHIDMVGNKKPLVPLEIKDLYMCPPEVKTVTIKAFIKQRTKAGKALCQEVTGSSSVKDSGRMKKRQKEESVLRLVQSCDGAQKIKLKSESSPIALMEDVMDKGSKKRKLISMETAEDFKKYYPFAPKVFEIEVERCIRAPSTMVYRPFDEAHCKNLIRSFLKNIRDVDNLADLVPFDPKTGKEVIVTEEDQLRKEHGLCFWIINGQHTITAAKALQTMPFQQGRDTPESISDNKGIQTAKQIHSTRKSRIICGCPPEKLVQISMQTNKDAKTFGLFKTPLHLSIMHAREQWESYGMISRPKIGQTQSPKWKVCLGFYRKILLVQCFIFS